MSAHTPGPWSINQHWLPPEHPDWREVVSEYDEKYRRMSVNGHCGEANARLIAAAPDLLEALQLALTELDGLNLDAIGFDRTTLETMREAIAKAVQP